MLATSSTPTGMKYERYRLEEREWHKVIIWTDDVGMGRLPLRDRIKHALERHTSSPCMFRCGQDWNLIMIASDEDYISLKLFLDISPEQYRGFGNWAAKKYSSANTNRIGVPRWVTGQK